jgi:hypothetical protein
MASTDSDDARSEVRDLVPLHEAFTRQLDSLRLGLGAGEAALASPLYEKALRYERLVGRLENRIRVAMFRLVRATDR